MIVLEFHALEHMRNYFYKRTNSPNNGSAEIGCGSASRKETKLECDRGNENKTEGFSGKRIIREAHRRRSEGENCGRVEEEIRRKSEGDSGKRIEEGTIVSGTGGVNGKIIKLGNIIRSEEDSEYIESRVKGERLDFKFNFKSIWCYMKRNG